MRRLVLKNLLNRPVTERAPTAADASLAELAEALDRAARRKLGRSLAIREVDAGSCNGCELEIHALNNAFYDLERFGLKIRGLAAPCRCASRHRARHQEHARGAAQDLHRHAG